ncbi:hypothetical protein QNM99_24705 [Pseudomonas sp. PCH446]
MVEDPSYLLLQLKLIKERDFKIITVPRLDDGPDLAAMEAMLIKYRPKLFLTQTLVHNPTGAVRLRKRASGCCRWPASMIFTSSKMIFSVRFRPGRRSGSPAWTAATGLSISAVSARS